MAAWVAQLNSASPNGQNLSIAVTYYLATDVGFTTPLTTGLTIVPSSATPQNIQKQIIADGTALRNSYNLIATYTGTTVNIP